jgi:hypothetical protein
MRKLLAIAVALLWSAGAQALEGEYGFTGTTFCFTTSTAFNSVFEPAGAGSVTNGVQSGTYVFSDDGTATLTGVETLNFTFSTTTANGGASRGNPTTLHYTVADDVLTIIGGYTTTGTVTAGPRAGQTFTITNLIGSTGFISRGRNTLTLTTLTPGIEIITYSGAPAGQGGPYNRFCGVQRTLTRLDNQ